MIEAMGFFYAAQYDGSTESAEDVMDAMSHTGILNRTFSWSIQTNGNLQINKRDGSIQQPMIAAPVGSWVVCSPEVSLPIICTDYMYQEKWRPASTYALAADLEATNAALAALTEQVNALS